MATTIPPNDPQSPRWLLDLEKWEILPYTQVPQDILDVQGYGVVSYTWGYIVDKGNPALDPPRGLLWDVPGVTKWPLTKAREIMGKIGTRFIWWDWMCVPQRGERKLSPELQKVQAEEIGKQMHIYKKAKKSIVWLHSTSWTEESALKTLLHLRSPQVDDKEQEPTYMKTYIDQVKNQLDEAGKKERWLRSGWTLQEGVLLDETDLIDGNGDILPGQHFFMSDQATVCDLTVPISRLAFELAIGYFIRTQGHQPDIGSEEATIHAAWLFSKMPDVWLRQSIQTLMASGFVGFWKDSPLDILAGKRSRTFGNEKDSCWALVGALGVEDVDITYDKDVSMEEVKRRLLVALFNKYQWRMLSLPLPEFDFKWTDIAEGVMLPVHVFGVEESPQEDVPTLNYNGELRIKANKDEKIILYRALKDTRFRHYRQDTDGLKIVSEMDSKLSNAWLLPLHDINMKVGTPGKRCLVLLGFDGPLGHASFGGIIDIQDIGPEKVEIDEIILRPSL